MRHAHRIALLVAMLAAVVPGRSSAQGAFKAILEGFSEVPAVSSTGFGEFRAELSSDASQISFELTYADLEGTAAAAHIHLGQPGVNGGVIAFLCGGGGKPACPTEATASPVTGVIEAADVIGPADQGIAATEIAEVFGAVRAGATYVNVHTDKHPGGEIRGAVTRGEGR